MLMWVYSLTEYDYKFFFFSNFCYIKLVKQFCFVFFLLSIFCYFALKMCANTYAKHLIWNIATYKIPANIMCFTNVASNIVTVSVYLLLHLFLSVLITKSDKRSRMLFSSTLLLFEKFRCTKNKIKRLS